MVIPFGGSIFVVIGLSGGRIFVVGIFDSVMAVATADLVVWRVGVTAAARLGIVSAVFTVQHSVTTLALSVVVHGRATAVRVRPEHAVTEPSVAAHLVVVRGFPIVLAAAARVILPVDDGISATLGIAPELLLHNGLVAALVLVEVVQHGSAAGGVGAVRAFLQRAFAADEVPVVVRRLAAAASVAVVRLGSQDAAAADVRVRVVRVVATAARFAAVILPLQLSVATDVVVTVVDFSAATAVRRPLVDAVPAAAAVQAVGLVDHAFAVTAKMRVRAVEFASAAGAVFAPRPPMDHASAAPVVSPVVRDAVAAGRVRTVLAFAYAIVVVRCGLTGP